jgi:hypothetical protein
MWCDYATEYEKIIVYMYDSVQYFDVYEVLSSGCNEFIWAYQK